MLDLEHNLWLEFWRETDDFLYSEWTPYLVIFQDLSS